MLKNLAVNMFRPGYFPVMAEKVWRRVAERGHRAEATAWCTAHVEPLDGFAAGLDAALWAETEAFAQALRTRAAAQLATIDLDLGGEGDYRLLYFLTRYLRPNSVVETGVGAGFSSQAMLTALAANGAGRLASSDFPYFRYKDPAQYVGFLVEDCVKGPWTLHLEGDRKNLPRICAAAGTINLFHYDSDKSYAGRALAMDMVRPSLADDALVIMDDIENNLYFRDYVEAQAQPFRIFGFREKYIGIIGGIGL